MAAVLLWPAIVLAQTATDPITAASAMTHVATAVEEGLSGIAASGREGVLSIGRALFGFFVVLNLVWMLLKSFVTGAGLFNGFIADFVPFAISAGVVALFLDQDVAAALSATLLVLGTAVVGEGVASVASMISVAGQQAFTAVANVWSVAPSTQVSWDPSTWFAAIPVILYSLAGTACTVFFLLFSLAIYLANLVLSQVAISIAMILAPFFVPFLLFTPAAWLFDGWLRFFLGAAMMKIIGLLMLKITGAMMTSLVALSQQAAAAKPTVLDAVGVDIVLFSSMILLAGLSALLMAQVPSLATGLISGSAGGASFASWAGIAVRSSATRAILGGIGTASPYRPGRHAGTFLTQAAPNIVKPVTSAAGIALSRFAGAKLADRDVSAARKSNALNGTFVIGRDVSRLSSVATESYVRRLSRLNSATAGREGRGAFVGPPSPNVVLVRPRGPSAR